MVSEKESKEWAKEKERDAQKRSLGEIKMYFKVRVYVI